MQLNYTKQTLDKLELLLKKLGYQLRVEKGNFRTGSCLLAQHKVIVMNKFSNIESRIDALVALIQETQLAPEHPLDEKQLHFFNQLKQKSITF